MNSKYRKLFTKIGLWYGISGALVFILFTILGMINSGSESYSLPAPLSVSFAVILAPFLIFAFFFSTTGIFGCNFKIDTCSFEYIFGAVIASFVIFGLCYIIGVIVDSSKNKIQINDK